MLQQDRILDGSAFDEAYRVPQKRLQRLFEREIVPHPRSEIRTRTILDDETLERIYIGRKFKNDTERLVKLFELYAKMVAAQPASKERKPRKESPDQLEVLEDA